MKASIEIIETNDQIQQAILKALLKDVGKTMVKSAKILENKLPTIIETAIISQPEYVSLVSGQLKQEFGIPDARSKIEQLLQIWKNVEVNYSKPTIKGGQIVSKISIYAIRSDYSDVIGLAAAYQRTKKGQSLPWLDWLLNQGDKVIIKEYEIVDGKKGRAGDKVMKKTVRGKWSVPSSFAGNPNNNWITRAIDSVSSVIEKTVEESLK
tara:strand:- start:1249 stop:1875 length:627 start_codon:yes stop_codon:yes gene_type:complete